MAKSKKNYRKQQSKHDQLEGRNIIVEVLRRKKRKVHEIFVDVRAKQDHKIQEILSLAKKRGISLQQISRQELDEKSVTGVHNGVIAIADPHPSYTTLEIIDSAYARNEQPFLVMVDELNYEQNLGAILRSSMGAGVHGVIIPDVRGKGLTPIVQRVAMGGSEEVPLVREGLFNAIKHIKKAGVTVVGADMDGVPIWDLPLQGAVAFVFGGESKGLSPTLRNKCDHIASVPLNLGLESLNVSVTAGVFLFEKNRQERE
jgi:23S rRNA (guanosine2251-2'-O)-methyltransferase